MDWFLIREFFRETSLDMASIIFIFGIFYVMIALAVVLLCEIKINRIERQKQKEMKNIELEAKGKDVTTVFMERQQDAVGKKYQCKLDELNMKRKFILERLPFFKN